MVHLKMLPCILHVFVAQETSHLSFRSGVVARAVEVLLHFAHGQRQVAVVTKTSTNVVRDVIVTS